MSYKRGVKMVKTAVLVSGGGMNLQSLIDSRMFGEIPECELTAVISSNPDAYALKRAETALIPTYIIDRNMFPSQSVFGFALLDKLRDLDIGLVVLAGFDCELTQPIFKHFGGRIISTYPSLMPAFTEAGHSDAEIIEAQLAAGVRISGATAYFVTEGQTAGPIILQKAVAVRHDDSASSLRSRILEEGENYILPRAVDLYCRGLLKTENGVVRIEGLAASAEEELTK